MNANDAVLLTVVGNILAIYDRLSELNRPGVARAVLAAAAADVSSGKGRLDECWRRHFEPFARLGEVAIWTTFFDGIFKLNFAGDWVPDSGPPASWNDGFLFGADDGRVGLKCPSGDIFVANLEDVGTSRAVKVPGKRAEGFYWLALNRDFAAEAIHSEVVQYKDYPASEGPDWTIFAKRAT